MKIGASLTTGFPLSIDDRTAARMLVERATTVRAAGLDSLVVGDHHVMGRHYFQNVPLIGRLIAEVGDTTIGALFLMPLHHPVLMAEQVGTLAALAAGRFLLIAALGYGGQEFAAFGVPNRQRPSRMEEHLMIVRRLLDGDTVSYEGRYHTLKDVAIHPTSPEPVEVWIAGSARPALERAGAMADAWLAAPSVIGEELSTSAAIYRTAALRSGKRPLLTVRRDIYVGESDAEAEETTAPVLAAGHRGFAREAMLIGGPETVLTGLRELHDQGFDHVLVRHMITDQEKILASYRRLGAEVLPEAHRWGSHP